MIHTNDKLLTTDRSNDTQTKYLFIYPDGPQLLTVHEAINHHEDPDLDAYGVYMVTCDGDIISVAIEDCYPAWDGAGRHLPGYEFEIKDWQEGGGGALLERIRYASSTRGLVFYHEVYVNGFPQQ